MPLLSVTDEHGNSRKRTLSPRKLLSHLPCIVILSALWREGPMQWAAPLMQVGQRPENTDHVVEVTAGVAAVRASSCVERRVESRG